jgi:hypothetical protein
MMDNRKWSAEEMAPRRSRRRALVGAAVVLAVLVVVGLYSAVRAADGKCPNRLPFCFNSKDPARAADVNQNFSQVLEWLEQKVGPVGTTGVVVDGNLSVKGTNVVVAGNLSAKGLEITDGYALRNTGDTWLRLTKGAGSDSYADLAVGRLYQLSASDTVISPRLTFKALATEQVPTRSTTEIPESVMNDYCGDDDGCRITLIMRNWDSAGINPDASVGPYYFHYNTKSKMFRVAYFPHEFWYAGGTNGNSKTEHAMRAWDCFLTDGLYALGPDSSTDTPGSSMYLLNYALNYKADCVLLIDD